MVFKTEKTFENSKVENRIEKTFIMGLRSNSNAFSTKYLSHLHFYARLDLHLLIIISLTYNITDISTTIGFFQTKKRFNCYCTIGKYFIINSLFVTRWPLTPEGEGEGRGVLPL